MSRAPAVEPSADQVLETGLDGDDLVDDEHLHHPGLTERVATFGRSTIVTVGLCALFGAFIAAAIVFVTPADAVLVAKQVLVWLTVTLLILTVVYGVVHGVAWAARRRKATQPALVPQTDLAILNWRREKSVFLGPTSRRRMRAGSSSCGWPSSSARNPAGPANRGPGIASLRASSITRSGDSCSRCCCPSCGASASCPKHSGTGSAIR